MLRHLSIRADCGDSQGMNRYPYYEVSAFTTEGSRGPFSGNPAGVVLLDSWLPEATMQRVAEQNNLAETAFLVPEGDGYRIRWFTPTSEIDLFGHATLGRDLALILPTEDDVRGFNALNPGVADLPGLGCIVTARSENYDFVSRAFFPEVGIVEDSVTGSAHCFLAWIWGNKLTKEALRAHQASPRGGDLWIKRHGDRVLLQGRAREYLRGEIVIPRE